MDTARITVSPEFGLIIAEDLVNLDRDWVESVRTHFVCETDGCDARVVAVIGRPPLQRRTPHFRSHPDAVHEPECPYADVVVEATGNGGDPENPLTGRHSYPSRLVPLTERTVTDPTGDDTADHIRSGPTSRRTRGNGSGAVDHHTRGIARTIRPLCRTFIAHPDHRRDMLIDIPDIDATHYQFAFKRLRDTAEPLTRERYRRIFYAPLRIFEQPDETEETKDRTVIALYAGRRDAADHRPTHAYRILVDHTDWTDSRIRTLRRDLRDARVEAKSDYHTGTPTKTWAFFIGSQDTDDPATFRVDNPVHICFITAEITYPTF